MLMIRPRIAGGASNWRRVLAVVWKRMLETPSATTTGIANHQARVKASAKRRRLTPVAPIRRRVREGAPDEATPTAANTEPTPMVEVSRPNPLGPAWRRYFEM